VTCVGDLIEEFKERPHAGEELPVLTLTERNGFVLQSERFKKRLATEDTSSYMRIGRHDIAFNPYLLWAGAVAQNTIVDAGVISPLYPTFRARPGVDARYVNYLLLSRRMISAYDGIAFGSVPRRRRSSVSDFLSLPVAALPSLREQQQVAALLSQADRLEQLCLRAIAELDRLIPSLYQSSFGDPEDAIRSGRTVLLSDVVADLQGGKSLVADDPALKSRNRVLKISSVTRGIFAPEESKPLPHDYVPAKDHFVRDGDLLISRANTRELVGAVALAQSPPPNLVLPDKLWRFVWRDPSTVEPLFVLAMLRTPAMRRQLSERASGTGGSMKNISKAKLQSMPVVWPSVAEQRAFADRVRAVDALRVKYVTRAEAPLRAALAARAFSGQL